MPSTMTNPGWVTEDRNARQPTATDTLFPSTSPSAGIDPPLLAQIPDLDETEAEPEPGPEPGDRAEEAGEGRILSQSLSNKLVLGAGILLVVAAILPYTMGKASSEVKPIANELPVWHPEGTPPVGATTPAAGPQLGAPGGTSTPGTGATFEANRAAPAVPPAYLTPQPAQVGTNRPMALGDPAWPVTAAEANRPMNQTAQDHPADYRVSDPSEFRPSAASPDLRNYQADRRSDPAMQYRGNQDSPTAEPGVAQFEGTIGKPPVRNSYDRVGSSNN